MTSALVIPASLAAHLAADLGSWPPASAGVTVTTSARRSQPGWDGTVFAFRGVVADSGTVLSVPADRIEAVRGVVGPLSDAGPLGSQLLGRGPQVAEAMGQPGSRLGAGVFRWSTQPRDLPDAGEWVPRDDPRVLPWLKPFNGEVLITADSDGLLAGVGLKRHDPNVWEIAVVTEERGRGRGLARRLVAQAARYILAAGAVPLYLHAEDNHASAAVADAVGFPDVGWRILGLWQTTPAEPPRP